MTRDLNKGITHIEYNHLNLPTRVEWASGQVQETLYDASGMKLQKRDYKADTLHQTIDYVGEFVYVTEGSGQRALQLIQHEEGRLVPNESKGTFEFQYHLKDYLGNVRITFSTMPEHYTMREDFEGGDNGFTDLHQHTDANANITTPYASHNKVGLLQSGQTGAMVFLSVNKRDTVDLSVKVNYETAPSGNGFLGTAYATLFGEFNNVYGSGVEGGVSANSGEFNDALAGTDMANKGSSNDAPRAFLNYICFDSEMNYVRAGFKQLTTAALRTAPHDYEQISLNDIIADREGYILAYLSNENAEEVAIHWDDFTVYHGKTNVVQAQNFYPFGLQFGEYQRTASTPQRYLFNQGIGAINFPTERIFELDVDMTKHRVYDYVLGRFWQVDPLANVASQESWTSYHYALNNPILYSDPYGDCPKCWKGLKRLFWDPIVKTRKWTVKKQAVYGTPTRTQLGKNITGNYLGDAAFHLLGGPIFQRALDGDHRAQGQLIMGGLLALHPGSRSQFKSSGIVNKLINDADNASDLMFIVGKKGDDVTRYLDVQGAEAAFMAGDESTILLREGASIETVTEEIIHFNQFKKHGEKYFLKNRTKLEIEAQDHLLKIGKDEGWSDKVMERIRNAKESWQQLLEKETQNGGS